MSGQSTPLSKTSHDENDMQQWSIITLLSFFCITSIFNSETKTITIGSHNLHSFKTSVDYHRSCIESHRGIWFAQEHWLSEKQLHLMHQLNSQFTARSGMEQSLSSGVMKGRPYGGISIAWSSELNHVITPLSNSFFYFSLGIVRDIVLLFILTRGLDSVGSMYVFILLRFVFFSFCSFFWWAKVNLRT